MHFKHVQCSACKLRLRKVVKIPLTMLLSIFLSIFSLPLSEKMTFYYIQYYKDVFFIFIRDMYKFQNIYKVIVYNSHNANLKILWMIHFDRECD